MWRGRRLALLRPPPSLGFALAASRLGRGLLALWRHTQEALHNFALAVGYAFEGVSQWIIAPEPIASRTIFEPLGPRHCDKLELRSSG